MQGRSWGQLAAVLLVGMGLASTAWAQPMTRGGRPVGAPHPSELFDYWFGGGKAKSAKDRKKAAAPAPSKPRPAAEPASEPKPSPADSAIDRFDREQRAFLRRMAVCDKLRQIALQTQDESLYRQADELEAQAWALCQERTGMIPVDGSPSVDERILDQHLGTEARSARIDRLYTVPGRQGPAVPPLVAQEEEEP